jgi:hypothetical protein
MILNVPRKPLKEVLKPSTIVRLFHDPRDGKVVLHTCFQASWPPKRHSFGSKPKVHKQVLVSPMEANGVEAQNEHFLSPPNRWTN